MASKAAQAAVVVCALLAGVGVGVGGQRLTTGGVGDVPTDPSASLAPSTKPAKSSPKPTPSPTKKPSPSPSASKTPSASASSSDAPAFTVRALLTADDFTAHGWGKATVVNTSEGAGEPVTACGGLSGDDVVATFSGVYRGRQTDGGEQVSRYRSVDDARRAAKQARTDAAQCGYHIDGSDTPNLSGISEAAYWEQSNGDTHVVVAVVRVDDRVLMLSLQSETSNPAETTDLLPLLTQAGRRLV